MPTLKDSTNKLVDVTEKLLQRFQVESAERKADEEKFNAQINEFKEKLSTALLQIEKLTTENKECSKELEACTNTTNPLIQSHDTADLSAEEIDALVKEIDSCLSLLS
jgi:hypothetical protein